MHGPVVDFYLLAVPDVRWFSTVLADVMESLFSDDERGQIASAIEAAEARTAAEIVPYVVVQSDAYSAARWRGGVLGALTAVAVAALLREWSRTVLAPYLTDAAVLSGALGVGMLGALLTGAIPFLTRALTPDEELRRAVYRRALQAFVDEEVFATDERIGILLFVSLMEHRIEVLADRGIDEKVDEAAWTDVTDHIRRGIEEDRLTRGLLNGIERCGTLLDERGVEPDSDGPDERSNQHRRGNQ